MMCQNMEVAMPGNKEGGDVAAEGTGAGTRTGGPKLGPTSDQTWITGVFSLWSFTKVHVVEAVRLDSSTSL